MSTYTYLGKSFPDLHGNDKVTGKAVYAGDLRLDNMLYGKILHSPHSHARILNIDTAAAERLAGVKAVVTARDTPGERVGRFIQDRPLLALGEVKYKGEPVAAVAAVDDQTALDALELIQVEYEPLPAVFDPFEAMHPDSLLVHPDNETFAPRPPVRNARGNIVDQVHVVQGDVEKALAACDVVHTEKYDTPTVHAGYMEPHAAVALVDGAGNATLWCSTKAPFLLREHTSRLLKIPISRLRVIAPTLGGDFGGKGTATIEPLSLLLALKSGCPVKLVLTREEEFTCLPLREVAVMELTLGATRDGTLSVLKAKTVLDSGAYNDTIGKVEGSALNLMGAYRIAHVDLRAYLVYTNNPPKGHVRAPRAPSPIFAIESCVDAISRKLNMDPLELRLKNLSLDGDRIPGNKGILRPAGLKSVLLATQRYLKKEKGPRQENTGWGVACGIWSNRPIMPQGPNSSAWVKMNADGTVLLITGATENGGGQYSAFAQIVSEVLSIPFDAVTVVGADTGIAPYEQGTGGSQTMYRVGTSVRLAVEDAKKQLLELAAQQLDAPEEILDMKDGRVFVKTMPARSVSLDVLAAASLSSAKGPILGVGQQERKAFLKEMAAHTGDVDSGTYGMHAAQVAVDPKTGQVRVLKYFAAHEVGFAIDPENVRKQIEGGVVFGLGFAMTEEVKIKQGSTLTESFMDYKMPTITMAPVSEVEIVEIPCKFGPYGAKGIGEPPVVPVAPAIANAVYDATGVRVTQLPITPERVYEGLRKKERLSIEK
ncbi:MAG: xanthine dehydrogenase family protein molybdopterin-binding subunit [Desulfobacterales bacterium]|nr:xanthine dehydrogenase family protein molybdopterin-binding subunit [Desulfobacterales bacterium]